MNSTFNTEPAAIAAGTPQQASGSAPNFDGLAKIYRWMELATFGPLLAKCRAAFLPQLASARRALVVGDGDGRFAAELLRVNSQVQIDAVDASPAMLDTLHGRARADAHRVSIHCADARAWRPESAQYDLVATHFFLDCLTTEECRALAMKLRGAVSHGALWIVSEFAIPEGWFGRFVARPLVWLLYCAFGLFTGLRVRRLPDHHAALRCAGFELIERRCRLRGLLVSEMWGAEERFANQTLKCRSFDSDRFAIFAQDDRSCKEDCT
jgi:SAM-dependent methyltransferase